MTQVAQRGGGCLVLETSRVWLDRAQSNLIKLVGVPVHCKGEGLNDV